MSQVSREFPQFTPDNTSIAWRPLPSTSSPIHHASIILASDTTVYILTASSHNPRSITPVHLLQACGRRARRKPNLVMTSGTSPTGMSWFLQSGERRKVSTKASLYPTPRIKVQFAKGNVSFQDRINITWYPELQGRKLHFGTQHTFQSNSKVRRGGGGDDQHMSKFNEGTSHFVYPTARRKSFA
jgi:hypothetical protein